MTSFKMVVLFLLLMITSQVQAKSSTEEYQPCGGKPADIVMVLDSSSSIEEDDYKKQLRFASNLIDLFDIGPNKTRIGVISFSKSVIEEFGLEDFDTRDDMKNEILHIPYQGGGTNTGEALHYLRTKAFNEDNKRQDVPRIGIVLTDGMSQNMHRTLMESKIAHTQGIKIFAIGIGSQVDDFELSAIASKPSAQYRFMIDDFEGLNNIKEELAIRACRVPPAEPKPRLDKDAVLYRGARCTPAVPLEINVAFDSAGIGADNSKLVMKFAANVADRLQHKPTDLRMGTISNGCRAVNFDGVTLGSGQDSQMIAKSFSSSKYPVLASLIRKMKLSFKNESMEDLGIVFLTERLNAEDFLSAKRELRRASFGGVKIFVIGVGDHVANFQGKRLATTTDNYIYAPTFGSLINLEGPLLVSICSLSSSDRDNFM